MIDKATIVFYDGIMHQEKLTFLKILFTVGLLATLPVTLILTNSTRQSQDVRSKAANTLPTPNKIIYVPFSFSRDKDKDGLLEFEGQPQIRNGFVQPPVAGTGAQFTAVVLDASGQTIRTQKFSIPKLVAIDSIDRITNRQQAELRDVSNDNIGLTLPYDSNAAYLKIINPNGFTINMVSLQNSSSFDNVIDLKEIREKDIKNPGSMNIFPSFKNRVFAANGSFNIAIIGDNYNGDNLHFQADVNDIAAGLLSVEPFASNKSNIVFYPQLSTVSLCTYSGNLSCNDTLSLQQASQVPYDKVYVLYNGSYAGYAYVGGTLAYGTNTTDKSKAVKQGLFIHELAGHVLGGLMDEYSYGATGASYAPNCSALSSCPSWSSIPGLGCFNTCGYTNLFRATDNSSVMNTALLNGVINFDPFSTQVVSGKLLSYFTINPPTATIPPPVPTPTVTTIPSPTPTSAPTAVPTITIATSSGIRSTQGGGFSPITANTNITGTPPPTAAPTVTSIPSAVPSPTPARCSFPNFCTGPSFCETGDIIQLSCDSSAVVCCKVQIPQNNTTPTQPPKFDPLPTVPVSATQNPTPTTPITNTPIPTGISSQRIQEQTVVPTNPVSQVTLPTPSPTVVFLNPNSALPTAVPPTPRPTAAEENAPLYTPPTLTPYQVEKIIFERATPTPVPKLGFLDILTAPSKFANRLIRSFFSIFSGE